MASQNPVILAKRLADAYFTGTFKALLVSSLPSEANFDAYDFRDDVANAVAASGTYAADGVATTPTVGSVDTTNNRVAVTFSNPESLTGTTITARGCWIYKVIGSAATDQLVTFVDFGSDKISTGGAFDITFTAPLYINA